jgi:hypothetical protein
MARVCGEERLITAAQTHHSCRNIENPGASIPHATVSHANRHAHSRSLYFGNRYGVVGWTAADDFGANVVLRIRVELLGVVALETSRAGAFQSRHANGRRAGGEHRHRHHARYQEQPIASHADHAFQKKIKSAECRAIAVFREGKYQAPPLRSKGLFPQGLLPLARGKFGLISMARQSRRPQQ